MALAVGDTIRIPCEVKPGPFSNERMVWVHGPEGDWFGFVDVRSLHQPIQEGETFVAARVVALDGDLFTARMPGHPARESTFRGPTAQVVTGGPVPA